MKKHTLYFDKNATVDLDLSAEAYCFNLTDMLSKYLIVL